MIGVFFILSTAFTTDIIVTLVVDDISYVVLHIASLKTLRNPWLHALRMIDIHFSRFNVTNGFTIKQLCWCDELDVLCECLIYVW